MQTENKGRIWRWLPWLVVPRSLVLLAAASLTSSPSRAGEPQASFTLRVPGREFTYHIRVRWRDANGQMVEKERTVTFHLDDHLNLDDKPKGCGALELRSDCSRPTGEGEFPDRNGEGQGRQGSGHGRQRKLLEERYALTPRPDEKVTMSRGKPIQVGPTAKLPEEVLGDTGRAVQRRDP